MMILATFSSCCCYEYENFGSNFLLPLQKLLLLLLLVLKFGCLFLLLVPG